MKKHNEFKCDELWSQLRCNIDEGRTNNYKSVLHYSNIKRMISQKLSPVLRGLYQKIANKLNYFKK